MVIVYCLQTLHRQGGIERIVTTKANWLAQNGYKVHIVTTDQRDAPITFPLSEGVEHHDLGLNYELDNSLGKWGRIRALWRKRPLHKQRLEDLLRRVGADITVSTFFQDASLLPSLKDGSKKVLEMHTSRYARVYMYPQEEKLMRLYGKFRQWQDEWIANKYDAFVILTNVERDLYKTQHNLHIIPNACVLPEYGYSDLSKPRAIAAGRLEYVKNFESLIRVWAKVVQHCPEWQLSIYGEGPLHHPLLQQVKSLGLEQSVLLPGGTARIDECFRQSSLCLMSSHFEGLPMVLLEAQTCGLPIIAYSCPSGPREVITQGVDGLLIPEGDEDAFAEAIISLIRDRDRMLSMATAAQSSAKRYELEVVMKQWTDLFGKLKTKT